MTTHQHNFDPTVGLCLCGNCKEAVEAALRVYEQTVEHQCQSWMSVINCVLAIILVGANGREMSMASLAVTNHYLLENPENRAALGERIAAIHERLGLPVEGKLL